MLVPQGIIGPAVCKDPYVQKSSVVDAFCNLIKLFFFDTPCLVFVFFFVVVCVLLPWAPSVTDPTDEQFIFKSQARVMTPMAWC